MSGRARRARRRTLRTRLGGAALGLTVLAACADATDVELLEIRASGTLTGQAYLDLDGNGAFTEVDEPLGGFALELRTATGGALVASTTSDAQGTFAFRDIAAGRYRLAPGGGLLGDSLRVVEGLDPVDVIIGEDAEALLGLSFHELTVEEVRAAPAGRRVFTGGIALNPRQSFSDGLVFLRGASDHLQAVDVGRTPPVALGDSVRLLGRIGRAGGRPALRDVRPVVLISQAQVPTPVEVTTRTAARADDGALDAALVRIRDAEVEDPRTEGSDYIFLADDGSGPVEVVLRDFLGFAVEPPDGSEIATATGLLQPVQVDGGVRWRLLVRAAAELVLAEP